MNVARDSRYVPWLVLAISLVVCFGWWRWAEAILVPSNTFFANAKGIPIGNNSDLYPRWLGAREALLNHRDPYSVEVTREIQRGFYGRYLDSANPSDPKDQAAFAYPLYVIFLLAPFVHLPFQLVLEIFGWIGLLSLAACVPLRVPSAKPRHVGCSHACSGGCSVGPRLVQAGRTYAGSFHHQTTTCRAVCLLLCIVGDGRLGETPTSYLEPCRELVGSDSRGG